MSRITIEQIQEELAADNWKLISTEYKNLDTELVFECDEGHQVYNTWKKIRQKRECPLCKQNQFKEIEQTLIPKKKGEIRTLGLDQATRITGWAIFSNENLIRYGTFETQEKDEIKRDLKVKNWLVNLVTNWGIDLVALEGIQYEERIGITTFSTLARLQGILMATLEEMGINYKVCPVASWRNFCEVKGKTRSDRKRSMQLHVKKWYDVSVSDDCADAIGIGKYGIEKAKKASIKIENWE